ncbi:hypothetical protein [Streptomyces sp. C8S0]|uniref:hypothetical protein n=1 Tax=Streptomyces sp. C8S0 TaxID=2585716 RepID=UPI00125E5265|nr:hypothetical protein [Streptomyces sp. C8S0]
MPFPVPHRRPLGLRQQRQAAGVRHPDRILHLAVIVQEGVVLGADHSRYQGAGVESLLVQTAQLHLGALQRHDTVHTALPPHPATQWQPAVMSRRGQRPNRGHPLSSQGLSLLVPAHIREVGSSGSVRSKASAPVHSRCQM